MMGWINKIIVVWLMLLEPASAITPLELVEQIQQHQGKVSFAGRRVQLLTRQTLSLRATMQVAYQDDQNYRVVILDPGKLANVNLWLKENRANIYFPAENLLFSNDNPSGATEFTATILGQITTNPDLLYRNYDLQVYSEETSKASSLVTQAAGRDCYILNVTPKSGYLVPGHRYWIAKDNFQILREERTWGADLPPYFQSFYDEFVPTRELDLAVRVVPDVNVVELKANSRDNSFVTYRTVPEAEKVLGASLWQPTFLPAGFALHGIQLPILYGSRMTLLSYTDGVNWLYVQYRAKPNLWVTLLAGAFALKLVAKFQEISFQAPYNYYGAEKGEVIVFSYGDLYPEELQRVGESLQLPASQR
ncbi:MAG: hypothetical protein HY692_01650 [Cyanobacteria bacterium NC_groundwater_1444_Ag_S-0.65um_54_12]|nr:hypothetical protein [Cyanobacteria bacterium NC_groundwater_1444_Ag_S-0.65um_54_12]